MKETGKVKCESCGEELLIPHEIQAKKCLTCMMIEFQDEGDYLHPKID